MGDEVTTYSDDLVIHHNGHDNLMAVLRFSKRYLTNANSVTVMGGGTGSVGSVIAATTLSENLYAGKNITQIGDSFGLAFNELMVRIVSDRLVQMNRELVSFNR